MSSTSTKPEVLEPHARHIGSAMLVINADGSWAVGASLASAVKLKFGDFTSINDATFGWSAVAVEKNTTGGYRLFVRNDANNDAVIEVAVDAAGNVSAASLALLTATQLMAAEEELKLDLNDSGGFGSGPLLLQGGAVNLYMNELGHYQLGEGTSALKTLTLGGAPLDDGLLPPGWEIVELAARSGGYNVFAQDPSGVVYNALFDSVGTYTGGDLLQGAALESFEQTSGLDINGDNSLAAPVGWTSAIGSPALKSAIDRALSGTPTGALSAEAGQAVALNAVAENTAPATAFTHAELVAMLNGMIQSHKANNNAPITAQEVADLQALAARGKAIFAGNGAAADYLSYVFGKLVEGSDANRFFNGGNTQRSELGSLGANSPVSVLEKLVDKWLLGGDAPSPATAGDSATGAAKSVTATYAKSSGPLFVDGITVTDVNQGSAGDCYLIAAMGGLAHTKPTAIEALFVENPPIDGARSWGVRFFDAAGKAHWVTVNDMLPIAQEGATTVAYAGPANKDLNGEIWVPLLEKAYAQANALGILPRAESTGQNSYAAVEGGQGDPLGALVASKVIAYSEPGSNFGNNGYLIPAAFDRNDPAARAKMEADLKLAINAGKTVWLGVTTTLKDGFNNQLLVGSHAHFLIDPDPSNPDNSNVLVYNPWGIVPQPNPPGPTPNNFISPAEFTLAQLVGIAGLDFMVLEGS